MAAGEPALRADVALVKAGLFDSRAKAREAIDAGLVTADGVIVAKAAALIAAGADLRASALYPWVSRGGVKLAAGLDHFALDPSGRACLDVGASTGGFAQVLLARGAVHVTAVDVGHGQLHPSLLSDPRVTMLEGRDARGLTIADFAAPPAFITVDVSFISLALVLPYVLPLAVTRAEAVLLVKPQFEAGRDRVRKGIVRDAAIHEEVCAAIAQAVADLGWSVLGLIPSPIEGGDGNREFLLGARR